MRTILDSNGRTPPQERAGVDIGIALRLARTDNPTSPVPGEAPFATSNVSDEAIASISFKGRLKSRLRPVAGAVYRLLKPLVRPLVFRLRAYFTAPVIAELQRQHAEAQGQREEARRQREEARRVHAASEDLLEQRFTAFSLHTVQELQHARDLLRRRIDALGQELEVVREMVPWLARIEQYGAASARRVALPCGTNETLVRTSAGYVVCPTSDAALLATLVEGSELESGSRTLIKQLLRPGDCFVDVGAHIGLHTLAAAFALQGKGRIVAFEPFPETFRLLQKTLSLNGFSSLVEMRESAASDRSGVQPLHLGNTSGHHSLYDLGDETGPTRPPLEVKVERIDEVLGHGARVDLVMIHVEGAELDVVAGASNTIASNAGLGLIVEFGASHLHRANRSIEDWLRAFERLGLDFGLIDEQTGALQKRTPRDFVGKNSVNLFFAQPDSSIWKRAWAAP